MGQELKKFYDLAADWKGRDQAGAEPLRPYLDAIAQISSPEDLAAYMCDREKNPLGLGILMPGAVTQSGLDPAVYLMKIEGPDRLLGSAEEYFNLDAGGMEQQEYVRKVTDHVLGALGYTEEEIRSLMPDNYRFEKKLRVRRSTWQRMRKRQSPFPLTSVRRPSSRTTLSAGSWMPGGCRGTYSSI